ncbi:hypothetical protein BDR07DRAFT_1295754 [Suillus spraguei]|nr:hypothetical protein BDR07DRAFT_1295754 [Suillus spraguei]
MFLVTYPLLWLGRSNNSHIVTFLHHGPFRVKKELNRFRILIIGRANGGKTTILQRVCKTQGTQRYITALGKSSQRGVHDIKNEMVFGSNPGFVFHDSCGFEPGGHTEFDKVKIFIAVGTKARRSMRDISYGSWSIFWRALSHVFGIGIAF